MIKAFRLIFGGDYAEVTLLGCGGGMPYQLDIYQQYCFNIKEERF